jgi:hypothetical protein
MWYPQILSPCSFGWWAETTHLWPHHNRYSRQTQFK